MAKIDQEETVVDTAKETVSEKSLLDIVQQQSQMIEKLQKEMSKISKESQIQKVADGKKRYEGQLEASYWMWGDKPVVGVISTKLNTEYDLLYKGQNGLWVDNHYVIVQYADGKETGKILRNSFEMSKVKSPLMPFSILGEDEDGNEITLKKVTVNNIGKIKVKKYIFETEDFGTLFISSNCIN